MWPSLLGQLVLPLPVSLDAPFLFIHSFITYLLTKNDSTPSFALEELVILWIQLWAKLTCKEIINMQYEKPYDGETDRGHGNQESNEPCLEQSGKASQKRESLS